MRENMSDRASYELVALLKRLSTLLYQNLDAKLKPYGLARTQYSVLRNVQQAGDLPTSELVSILQVEPATLSGLIDTLEAKGLVIRVEHAEDKRRKDVRLTDAGRKVVETIPPPGPLLEDVLRYEIDSGDVYILKAVGQQMIKNLEKELQEQEGWSGARKP
jgi:DNA-binding MarR family transcriptional regulator